MGRYDDLDEVPRSHLQAAEKLLDTVGQQADTLAQAGEKLREGLGGDQAPPELARAVESFTNAWGGKLQDLVHEHRVKLDGIAEMARAEQADSDSGDPDTDGQQRGRGPA